MSKYNSFNRLNYNKFGGEVISVREKIIELAKASQDINKNGILKSPENKKIADALKVDITNFLLEDNYCIKEGEKCKYPFEYVWTKNGNKHGIRLTNNDGSQTILSDFSDFIDYHFEQVLEKEKRIIQLEKEIDELEKRTKSQIVDSQIKDLQEELRKTREAKDKQDTAYELALKQIEDSYKAEKVKLNADHKIALESVSSENKIVVEGLEASLVKKQSEIDAKIIEINKEKAIAIQAVIDNESSKMQNLQNQIIEKDEKISRLNTSLSNCTKNEDLQTLKDQISSLTLDKTTLEGKVSETQQNLDKIKNDLEKQNDCLLDLNEEKVKFLDRKM